MNFFSSNKSLFYLILIQVIVTSTCSQPEASTAESLTCDDVPPNNPARRLATFIHSLILAEENFIVRPNGEKLYVLQPDIKIEINSPIYLVQLAHHEKGLYEVLREYYLKEMFVGGLGDSGSGALASNRWILPILGAYIKDYEESVIVTKVENNMNWINVQDMVSKHPLLVYRMIFRFVVYLQKIPNYVLQNEFGTDEKLVEDEPDFKKTWPTMADYEEVVVAFLRIQHTYNMDAKDLVSGNVMGNQIPIRLSLEQCLDIATHASTNKMYSLAIQWLEVARRVLEHDKPIYSTITYESLKNNVLLLLEHEIIQHDNYTSKGENVTQWGYYHFQTSLFNNGTLLRPNERISLRDISSEKNGSFIYGDTFDLYRYWNLCSGKRYQTEEENSNLYCYYEGSVHPTFLIGPLKIEFLTKSPEIVQIYDIIGPKVVESMVSVTWNKVERSRVVNVTHPGKTEKSNVRTSVEGWIWKPDQILNDLSRKIEVMTGLNVLRSKSSELYLAAGYSFGGHYECHLDAFKNPEENGERGNRIATMMFYLNEPEKGGYTAFPNLGIFARPVQYSGVFWYNLLPSGSRDLRTHHCACPVVLGHKWISTKWIRHYEQFRKKKCDLYENASFTFVPKKLYIFKHILSDPVLQSQPTVEG